MDYNTEKYNSLLFETQKNEFDKNIKSDRIYYALQTLSNLSYYNRLLEIPDDIDIAFSTFSNFLIPVVGGSENEGVKISPTMVIQVVELKENNVSFRKLEPGEQYQCIGIFIPYNQFLINYGDPKKPVPIDFLSGTNHKIYKEKDFGGSSGTEATLGWNSPKATSGTSGISGWNSQSTSRWNSQGTSGISGWNSQGTSGASRHFGGDAKPRKVTKLPKGTRGIRGETVVSKSKVDIDNVSLPFGKFVFFEKTNDPFGDALYILSSIEARNLAYHQMPRIRKYVGDRTPVNIVPKEYSSEIPKALKDIAGKILGGITFANPEDMWVKLYRAGKSTTFFRELYGLSLKKVNAVKMMERSTLDNYFKETLLEKRRKIAKSEQELQEMYRKDSISSDPLFAELNKYIIAIKGRRFNFLKARPTEFDEMLCQHYVEMKNYLLEEGDENDGVESMEKIINKYGDRTSISDGVYCSICGEIIVLEKTFLSAPDIVDPGDSGNLVPKNEITTMYYDMAYQIISSNILTEMNLKTLIDNIIYRIYPLILVAIEDISNDKPGIEVHVTMYLLAALMSLSILEPDTIAFKVFRDGTKKLSGNAIAQQKAIANEAKSILTTIRAHAIRESVYQRDAAYKYKMDEEAFPQVHKLFSQLMGSTGDDSFVTKDNEVVSDLTVGDLQGYNFYSAVEKMDNIAGGDGDILAIVLRNFVKSKSISTKSLLKGIYPEPTELKPSKRDLLFDKKGEFKNNAIKELLFPRVLSENEKHDILLALGPSGSSGSAVASGSSGVSAKLPDIKGLDLRKWHMRVKGDLGAFVTPTMTVSNLNYISSYGLVKYKTSEEYFCYDYRMHQMKPDGFFEGEFKRKCTICGYVDGSGKINSNPKYSRMMEFYNIYAISCPVLATGKDKESDELLIGNASGVTSKGDSADDLGLHDFSNGKCRNCGYLQKGDFKDQASFFEKYKDLLENKEFPDPETGDYPGGIVPGVPSKVTTMKMDRSVLESYNSNLEKVSKSFGIPTKRLVTLLDKPILNLNSILITYFKYNGELHYYKDSDDDVLLFAKSFLLTNMLRDSTAGKLFIKDESSIAGPIVFEEDEADDYTLDNAEDEPELEDPDDEILDLAPDEEDRFDEADAE